MQVLQDLTKEKYYISKFIHTSYVDLDEVTHVERSMILKFITEEKEAEQRKLRDIRNGKI